MIDNDFLYERERDDKDIERLEEEAKPERLTCDYCDIELDVNDLDRCDGEWICRECEFILGGGVE